MLFVTSCIPISRNKSIIFTVSIEHCISGVDEIVEVFILLEFYVDIAKLVH